MLPQPPNVLLSLEYCNVIISETGQKGSTADGCWATANQSNRAVIRLWHLIGWWKFRIPDLSNAHLTKHLWGGGKTKQNTFEIIALSSP